jgi:hypothetical protein
MNALSRFAMPEHDKFWTPYQPNEAMPWNFRRVVHLHRRAGFAAAWSEIQRDLKEGPAASVQRLLAGKSDSHAPGEFAATADLLAYAAVAAN